MNNQFIALIPCAGSGLRFGSTTPKQYAVIKHKTILQHTLEAFLAVKQISQIVIIASPTDNLIDDYLSLSPRIHIKKVGGLIRAQSVLNGLNQLNCAANDWVLVHDAARCCISPQLIKNLIAELQEDEIGGILAMPATDTIKYGENGQVSHTLDRAKIYLAQTPQMFRYQILHEGLTKANLSTITDEASIVEQLGLPVRLIKGDATNIKVTYPSDLILAELILASKQYKLNGQFLE